MNNAKARIAAYLKSDNKRPFFVSVDGPEYSEIMNSFPELSVLRVSSFCNGDCFPGRDYIMDAVRALESDTMLLGVGESSLLSNDYELMYYLYPYCLPKKLVVLCRGISSFLHQFSYEYPRVNRNLVFVKSSESFHVVRYESNLPVEGTLKGCKELLIKLEDGAVGRIEVSSRVQMYWADVILSAYRALKARNPSMKAPEVALTEEQWCRVLMGDKTWSKYLAGFDGIFDNDYERFAFGWPMNLDEVERSIFFAILLKDPTSPDFDKLYHLRKSLVAKFNKKYLAEYVEMAKERGADGLYYLTDNTSLEVQAAIELAPLNRAVFEKNFPSARRYLQKFDFEDDRLTNYFECYKDMKLFGICSEKFLLQVSLYAEWRIYNELETRAALLERIGGGTLYWMDGLSVDLLGYLRQRMAELGLRAKIQTARAELPTLTSVNKTFYEEWPFRKFPKNNRLDKLHHEARKDSPYFCDEISIIEDALQEIAASLNGGDTTKVILTSDHGSSRGVVRCRGHPLKMHVSGEHGGRCCKIDERDVKPKFAVEANGYYVLTNYDRIQGGRMDGAELHGGATLEEVLVPVIEIFI